MRTPPACLSLCRYYSTQERMPFELEAELKRVKATAKARKTQLRRDTGLTGGERAETPAERAQRCQRKSKPARPPIITRTP